MRVLIVGIVVLALAVTAVATYLVNTLAAPEAIEQVERAAEPIRPRVLVATRKLNRGDRLAPDMIRWQFWPEEAVNRLYVTVEKDDQEAGPIKEYTGAVLRDGVEAGEPILPSKVFKRGESGVMAGILAPGMRAVAVGVTPESASGGFILPGDRVDVLLSHNKAQEAIRARNDRMVQAGETPDDDEPMVVLSTTTETILRNVHVLATDGAVGPPEGSNVQARTVTLELTPKQTELISTAQTMGNLSLALRSMGAEEIAESPRTFTTDVEVSPFLSDMEAIITGEREQALSREIERLEQENRENAAKSQKQAEEIEALSRAAAQRAGQRVQPKPAPVVVPKDSTVTIYRGGASQVEELSQ